MDYHLKAFRSNLNPVLRQAHALLLGQHVSFT